ncbi:MAG: aromatic amino acid transport family protein [bacterium]|nr:aromatic amino acid transport family protein [bacterium]
MGKILKLAYPVSVLAGTIIGAGMFSLPFVFHNVGFILGFSYLIFFTFIFYITHTMYADIVLRTERLPGFVLYAKKYLGGWARIPATLATGVGTILVSAVYLVLVTSFVRLILPDASEGIVVFIFWSLGSLSIFLKAKRLAKIELFVVGAIIALIGIIFFLGINNSGDYARNFYMPEAALPLFIIPFGPILFSLSGRSAILPLLDDVRKSRIPESYVSKIIFLGTFIPAILYTLFVLGVWGLSDTVTNNAVSGIVRDTAVLLPVLGIVGIAALFTTYVPIGTSLKKILEADFNFSHMTSSVAVVILPPLIYLIGFDFLQLINIAGGIFLAVECIFIALIWNQLNKVHRPQLLLRGFGKGTAYLIIIVFTVGLIAEIYFI